MLASDLIRSEQTADVIAESLDSAKPEIDARIHERNDTSMMSRKERKKHPQYIKHKSLSPIEQFYHQPVPGYESGFEQYQRMEQAIYDFIGRIQPDQLGVGVTHSISLGSLMKGLQFNGHEIPHTFLKGMKYCEMLVLRVKENGMLQGLERKKIELPAKQAE